MKAKEIILHWIENKYRSNNKHFFSFDFENEIANYGRLAHQKVHTPSTYSRAFRAIRSSNSITRRGFQLEEVKHSNNKSKGWRIKKI